MANKRKPVNEAESPLRTVTMDEIMQSLGLKLIVSGMTALVEDEGKTPREVYEILEGLKRGLWASLCEIHNDKNTKK